MNLRRTTRAHGDDDFSAGWVVYATGIAAALITSVGARRAEPPPVHTSALEFPLNVDVVQFYGNLPQNPKCGFEFFSFLSRAHL